MSQRRVCQFSCGAASAVATKLTLAEFPDAVIINAFVKEENEDNRRFLADCEKWFERTVHVLRDEKYGASTNEVWRRKRYIKGKRGAPCSLALKRSLLNAFGAPGDIKVIGLTVEEQDRVDDLEAHFPEEFPSFSFPLVERGITHDDCLAIVDKAGILLPLMYRMGYQNANCVGCPKGGVRITGRRFATTFPRGSSKFRRFKRRSAQALTSLDSEVGRVRMSACRCGICPPASAI